MDTIHQAQEIINKFLEDRNQIIYAINPDGSVMELKSGFMLLDFKRYQMEEYIPERK